MNSRLAIATASKYCPVVVTNLQSGGGRDLVLQSLSGTKNVGIELGVAKGYFSKTLLESKKFATLYGVDAYRDIHDNEEYVGALKLTGISTSNFHLLRTDFKSALNLFDDEFFDFVYVDGYAHTGQEGGSTIHDWYKKVKPGGLIAGDDYHKDWPLVVWAVNHFATLVDQAVTVTEVKYENEYSAYPSWYLFKPHKEVVLHLDPRLVVLARREAKMISKTRYGLYALFRARCVTMSKVLGLHKWIRKFVLKRHI